jgi:subtilase family serine protease
MRFWKLVLPLLASTLSFAAQSDRITAPINSNQRIALAKSLHPKALPQFDQGTVDTSFELSYVTLVVAPSPGQQLALNQLLAQQQDRRSPNFHKWLTPEQYAARFGLSPNDVGKITNWLQAQGLTVLTVARARNSIIISGTAAQIQGAFSTEIHHYEINGERHIANSAQVMLPAALSGVVTQIRGLTDFHPKPMNGRPLRGTGVPRPRYTTTLQGDSEPSYFLAPGDIATIYDINSLYNATTPIDGAGQKLAIVGQTDVYLADINDFRSGFALDPITGCATNANNVITSCNSTYFQYIAVGSDPGTPYLCGDLSEADLDIEWSGATARKAQIVYVNAPVIWNANCTSGSGAGVNAALAYVIDNVTAPVVSVSYGLCELEAEPLETELQQANSEGITVMNSSGDSGAAICDGQPSTTRPPFAPASQGLSVSYPASSPEVTGVGGTSIPEADFTSTFWGAGNGTDGGSALPALAGQEVLWNDDSAFAQFCLSEPSNPFCTQGGSQAVAGWVAITSAQIAQNDIWISIGGGGVSNCFDETPEGICTSGFPKPAWQTGITIPGLTSPQSTYRFVPDVSLLASPNFPGYILCTPLNEIDEGSSTGSSCASGISTAVDTYFSIIGGTSASSPIFAGIVTLMNQYIGGSGLGNINPTLYSLAANPSNGAFHRVTSGTNDVYCAANTPTGQPADVICPSAAVFGFNGSASDTTTGYNLVTGLGSVDANALAAAWKATLDPDFALAAGTLTPSPVSAGQSTAATLTISPVAGSTGMVVNFSPNNCTGLPTGATCSFNPPSVNFNGTDPATTVVTIATIPTMVASGPQTITIAPTNSSVTTTSVNLTVTPTTESFTLTSTANSFSVAVGGTAQVPITVNSSTGFIVGSGSGATTAVPVTYTCSGIPVTAEISCQISPGSGQPTSAINVTVNLVTTPMTSQLQRPPLGRSRIFYALLLPGLFGVVFVMGSRTRGLRLLSLIVILGCSTLWLGSCGGSGGSGSTIPPNPGTPPGSYPGITINATTGGANPITSSFAITNFTVTQ